MSRRLNRNHVHFLRRACEIIENRVGANHPDIGAVLINLATVRTLQGRFDEAEKYLLRTRTIWKNPENWRSTSDQEKKRESIFSK